MDTQLLLFFNRSLASPFFDVLMPTLTFHGYLLAVPVLLYAVFTGATVRDDSGKTFLSAAIAAVVISLVSVTLADHACSWLKVVTARPRPCQALEDVRLIISCPRSLSFPSNHAATSFAFITPFFLLARRFIRAGWLAYLLILASLIALSRLYLGVHYPSDTLAGAAFGAALAGVMCWGYRMISKRSEGRNETSPR